MKTLNFLLFHYLILYGKLVYLGWSLWLIVMLRWAIQYWDLISLSLWCHTSMYNVLLKGQFCVILTLIFGTDMYNCEVYSNNRKESQMFHQVLRPPQTLYVDWLNLFFRFLIFTSLLNYFNSFPSVSSYARK